MKKACFKFSFIFVFLSNTLICQVMTIDEKQIFTENFSTLKKSLEIDQRGVYIGKNSLEFRKAEPKKTQFVVEENAVSRINFLYDYETISKVFAKIALEPQITQEKRWDVVDIQTKEGDFSVWETGKLKENKDPAGVFNKGIYKIILTNGVYQYVFEDLGKDYLLSISVIKDK